MTAIGTSRSSRMVSATTPRTWQHTYGRWLALGDLQAVTLAVGAAQWIRFGAPSQTVAFGGRYHFTYLEVSILIAILWMLALRINRSRSERVIGGGAEEYRRVWLGTLAVFGGVAIVSMLFKLEIARGYLLIALPLGMILLAVCRWLARCIVVRARQKYGHCVTRVVVVGSAAAATEMATGLSQETWSGYSVVGACIVGPENGTHLVVAGVDDIPNFGDETSVIGAVTATGSHAVVIAATEGLDGRRIRDLSWELEKLNVDLLVAPGVVDVAGPRLHMRPDAGLPLIHVEKPQYHGAKKFQKRLFDITFAGTALLLTLPVLVAIAIAVKVTSKGPALFRQERIGLDGRAFEMIKFRTMVDGADSLIEELRGVNESDSGVLFKIHNDPRITSVGRFLRKYSLDELPQFVNVLKRDMSVVGPRPPLATEVETYDQRVKRRLLVRPGVTGLWQVSGRSDLSWEDSVRLDLFYIENWSMIGDVLIALKTARVMVKHTGAY